jgi:hypothetical protein
MAEEVARVRRYSIRSANSIREISMRLAPFVALVAITLALSACTAAPPTTDPEPDVVTVSAECSAALAAFPDAVPLTDEETAAVTAMATGCATVAEFRAGIIENPDSWGFAADETDDQLEGLVFLTCQDNLDAPLCVDAAAQGIQVSLDE